MTDYSALIGPLPEVKTPKYPTPWRRDTDDSLVDANGNDIRDNYGHTVEFPPELTEAIVKAVNAYYGAPKPVLRDFIDASGNTVFEVAPGKIVQVRNSRAVAEDYYRRTGNYHKINEAWNQPLRDATTNEIIR